MPNPAAFVAIVLLSATMTAYAFAQSPSAQGGLGAPRHLRCEYLVDPLGIDRTAPRLSWEVIDPRRGAVQTAYQVLVADDPEMLKSDQGNLWDTGKIASDQSVQVAYAGQPLKSRMRLWWKMRTWDKQDQSSPWSAPARWSLGLLEPADWQAAWIGDATVLPPPAHTSLVDGDSTSHPASPLDPLPALMLRKVFHLMDPPPRGRADATPPPASAPVKRATIYVTALGLYELRINGQRVGDHLLAPEWTDYHTRLQYQTFDVTDLIRRDENVVAALLGDGWYAGRIGLSGIVPGGPIRAIYGRQPRLLLQMELELADGRIERVCSDGRWRFTTDGPIRASDILDGEVYDARREMPGWDAPGFDDSAWKAVGLCDLDPSHAPSGAETLPATGQSKLVAQPNEPIRVVKELKPIMLTEPKPGVYVYDMGQNMVGWCRMKLTGPAGATVTLRHAEVLNPDGTIYTANLRTARQTDQYTLRGPDGTSPSGAQEVFEPHFTYHGFRYVEVTGLAEKPALAALVGRVFCSAAPECGRFECSSPPLNRLMENIVWTQRANLLSVPTDCPQRDERLGWMGDILAFAQAACFNLDMAAFFTKWVPDIRDAQADDGRYPDFAPHPYDPNARFSGVPAWGDAGVFVPWCAYVNYADERLLAEHFASTRRWVDWVHANNPDSLWRNKRHNDYGDWLNADTLKLEGWPDKGAETPKEVFATMFFARSTELVSQMAAVLGCDDDARRYAGLAGDIRAAFVQAYVAPDGRIQGDTQAGYAIALHFNLLPQNLRPPAVKYLLEGFQKYSGNISTGFHGTICLMNELNRAGQVDEAYRLLNNRAMPSWLYPVEHGATTIWERWDGYVEGRGYQDPSMNSFAHYAFGCVGEWMYRTIIGINPDDPATSHEGWRPGYRHFILRPRPGGGLTWAKGEYNSIHGRIVSNWRLENGAFTLEITIPANTTATVFVPAADAAAVLEGDRPAEQAEGVKLLRMEDGATVYEVGAGSYRFTVRAAG
jgi:alpha-L-rhamnosidase